MDFSLRTITKYYCFKMDNNEASAVPPAAATTPVAVPPPPPPPPSTVPPLPPPAVRPRVNKNTDLANLFLSTTYAINKSNSKRVAVELEHQAGFYRAVVKLYSTEAPAKYVTFEKNNWELIVDQMNAIMGYLLNSFTFYKDFGKPSKIRLPTYNINFTTAYRVRSIVIDERPSVPTQKLVRLPRRPANRRGDAVFRLFFTVRDTTEEKKI